MSSIAHILHNAKSVLPNSDSAHLDCRLLLQNVLNCSATWLLANDDYCLSHKQMALFDDMIAMRQQHKPLAYIVGECEFWGLSLTLTEDVLIPRADTETLVEAALSYIAQNYADQPIHILDLGTGSGAIAIALASELPQAHVIAVDQSAAALVIATQNQQRHKLSNVQFIRSDWFAQITVQTFQVIVSNPPYIEAQDPHLQHPSLRYEPICALKAGDDGLDDIRTIIAHAAPYLDANGRLFIEHGYLQGTLVRQLFTEHEYSDIETCRDLQNHERVTAGTCGA